MAGESAITSTRFRGASSGSVRARCIPPSIDSRIGAPKLLRAKFALVGQNLLLIPDNRLLVPDYLLLIPDYRREPFLASDDPLFVRDDSLLVPDCRLCHYGVLVVRTQ